LQQLLANPQVKKVYCFIRTSGTGESATERLAAALKTHHQDHIPLSDKLVVLSADLSLPNFALSTTDFMMIRANITHIIHCAWASTLLFHYRASSLNLHPSRVFCPFLCLCAHPDPPTSYSVPRLVWLWELRHQLSFLLRRWL
jgi:hypothetical protein